MCGSLLLPLRSHGPVVWGPCRRRVIFLPIRKEAGNTHTPLVALSSPGGAADSSKPEVIVVQCPEVRVQQPYVLLPGRPNGVEVVLRFPLNKPVGQDQEGAREAREPA